MKWEERIEKRTKSRKNVKDEGTGSRKRTLEVGKHYYKQISLYIIGSVHRRESRKQEVSTGSMKSRNKVARVQGLRKYPKQEECVGKYYRKQEEDKASRKGEQENNITSRNGTRSRKSVGKEYKKQDEDTGSRK